MNRTTFVTGDIRNGLHCLDATLVPVEGGYEMQSVRTAIALNRRIPAMRKRWEMVGGSGHAWKRAANRFWHGSWPASSLRGKKKWTQTGACCPL
ncbi:MAG: hypothetical protein P8J33_00715 [Pirellulaceae bacterium]|nr:hypothetical protein [Pirellulaceae bacterium]